MSSHASPAIAPSPGANPREGSAARPTLQASGIATILLLGFPRPMNDELVATPPPGGRVVSVTDPASAVDALVETAARAICLGPSLSPAAIRSLVGRAFEGDPAVRVVVLGAGDDLEQFRDLVDADRLFYLTPRLPAPVEIRGILHAAITARLGGGPEPPPVPLLAVELILRFLSSIEEEEGDEGFSRLGAQAVQTLVDADVGECLLHDAADATLASWKPGTTEPRRESVAAGLVGWVVRTVTPVRLDRVGSDPRYEPEADTDGGSPRERFLAVPVPLGAAARATTVPQVGAVLVARRAEGATPFDEIDQAILSLFGDHLGAVLGRRALRWRLDNAAGPSAADSDDLFRGEALASHAAAGGTQARPLALAPAWSRRAYQLLLAGLVVGLAFVSWGSISEYAEGVAVVRVADHTEVTARAAGVVEEVPLSPGERVEAGALLARLDEAREAAELARIRRELELALVERLRDPTGGGRPGAIGSLREQLRLAAANLEARRVRAPRSGVVAETRIQVGQPVTPGAVVMTLAAPTSPASRPSLVVFFPGRHRSLLAEGMPLILELEGHRGVRLQARIEEVGDGVIGPAEARRIVGAGIADAIPLAGPLVSVRARLTSATFENAGETYRYHDGLIGNAEVRVRGESLLATLVPGLKGLSGGSNG